jgi:uncharacterized membrane-anchored protein
MDQELKMRIDAQDEKLAAIYKSVEATRKYFKWTMIITVALFVLPLIGLVFAIPSFLSTVAPNVGALQGI